MHVLGFVHGNLEIVSYHAHLPFARHILTVTSSKTNVLVDSEGTPRIGGLGSAISEFSSVARSESPDMLTRSSAPELVDPGAFELLDTQPTRASDVYAFGVLAYQVARTNHDSHTVYSNVGCRFLRVGPCSPTWAKSKQPT